jgi:hypothetical protein
MRTLFGFGLVVAGVGIAYGSGTGTLAPMLAALFAPSELVTKGGSSSGYDPLGVLGGVATVATAIVDPAAALLGL